MPGLNRAALDLRCAQDGQNWQASIKQRPCFVTGSLRRPLREKVLRTSAGQVWQRVAELSGRHAPVRGVQWALVAGDCLGADARRLHLPDLLRLQGRCVLAGLADPTLDHYKGKPHAEINDTCKTTQ